jgi:hypothetical protein
MTKRITVALLLLCALCVAAEERQKSIYKITRLSTTEVGISCLNGADPTSKKFGNVVIMSCGKE